MSDLISRSQVNDVIDELEVYTCGRPNTMKVEISVLQLQGLINKLKNIPTAYSVDKVVDELNELDVKSITRYKNGNFGNFDGVEYYIKKRKAIEIVQQCGVSDDVCEWRLCDEEANVYDTSCRNPHILIEGTPKENNYEYCPYCGKKIKVVE